MLQDLTAVPFSGYKYKLENDINEMKNKLDKLEAKFVNW